MKPFEPITPKVNEPTFFGVLWAGVAISLCFLVFRISVRIRAFRKVYADDYLVVLAWLIFFGSAILWQTQRYPIYEQFAVTAGHVPTLKFLTAYPIFLKAEIALIFLFYTSLWIVKLSFLIFFRRLGHKVRGQKVWWWCVVGITVASWATCIGAMQWNCLLGSLQYVFTQCSGPSSIRFEHQTIVYNCAIDVITDCLIITIPVFILWNVQISLRQKLALIAIFSLTVIVMIFAVVRVAVVLMLSVQSDITWLYMWSNIEIAVSIVVACLASFRQLFVKQDRSRQLPASGGNPFSSLGRGLLSTFRSRTKYSKKSQSRDGGFFSRTNLHKPTPSETSGEHIVPLNDIYVSSDIGVSTNVLGTEKQAPGAMVFGNCYTTPEGKSYLRPPASIVNASREEDRGEPTFI